MCLLWWCLAAALLCVASGKIPPADGAAFAALGSALEALTAFPLAVAPKSALNSLDVTWQLEPAIVISESGALLVLKEDLTRGQRIAGWTLEIFCQPGPGVAQCNGDGYWKQLLSGTTVGPKQFGNITNQGRS